MICYNVFLELSPEMDHKEWKTYMINDHIPAVMKTGCFLECKMMKDSSANNKWHIQYFLESGDAMNEYLNKFASDLKQEVVERYNGTFQANRTITEVIQSF